MSDSHEMLAQSSLQEIEVVTSEWESDPDRWKQDPATWPDLLEERLDSPGYVDHPLSDLRDLWGKAFLTEQEAFSEEFLTLLTFLHRTLVKDRSPRALVMEMRQDVDPDLANWAMAVHAEPGHSEVAFEPLPQMAARLADLSVDELRQLQAVWTKVAAMVEEVATFLEMSRPLTSNEAEWADRTAASPDRFAQRIAERSPNEQ